MILLTAFLVGDAWTWDVTLRYDDAEGTLLCDRERWTVRVGTGASLEAERTFVGTVLDDGMVVPSEGKPEIAKGKIEADGTLALKGDWSDPAATRILRRLLVPDLPKDELVTGWPVVRRGVRREAEVRLPGSGLEASLAVEARLASARLGGKAVPLSFDKSKDGIEILENVAATPTLSSSMGKES